MKDTFYFPHDHNARGDEKIINLIRAHKLEGYGVYWCLIEKLYESGGRIAADFDALAYDLRMSAETVKSIATKFGLFYLSGSSRFLGSKSVDRRLQERRERIEIARQKGIRSGQARREKRTAVEQVLNSGSTDVELERKKEKKERTAADGAPAAADLSRVVDGVVAKRSVTRALTKSDVELLDTQLPFGFGDIPRGRRIIDVDPVSAQAILDKVPRLGLDVRRALMARVALKAAEGMDSRRSA